MRSEKLFFKNSRGNKLCGLLTNPSGDNSRPVVVMCHGFNSGKDSSTNVGLTEYLERLDISSFRIDFFAHGESEGKFEDLTQTEAVDDILRAIDFLKSLGYRKIGLFGSSFGGLAALMAASKIGKEIFVLTLKAPISSYYDFPEYTDQSFIDEWREKGYSFREGKKLNYSFYEDIKNNVAYEVAGKIAVPTLIVHGAADTEVPITQSYKTVKLIRNCRLVDIPGAGHSFKEGDSKKILLKAVTDFIVEHSK